MNPLAWASSAARRISKSVAPGRPYRMFSDTVPEKIVGSWGTRERRSRKASGSTCAMSTPSMRTLPEAGS